MTTSIKWVVYDGTAMTRPHSIRKSFFQAGKRQQAKLSKPYLLRRAGSDNVEDQAFCFLADKKYRNGQDYFRGFLWRGFYDDCDEEFIEFPLTVGDAWAEWPLPPQQEMQP